MSSPARRDASRLLQTVAIILATIGIGIAAYLTITHARGEPPACLAGGHGCETVAASDYAQLGDVRVSVVGIVGYVLLLVLSLIRHPLARSLSLGGAVIAVIFSAYLTYLELHVIEAICQWCVGSAVIAALLLVVHGAWAYRDV